ncbi:MAG: hypothetical protein ACRD88_20570 [Terriglobia bacterium]
MVNLDNSRILTQIPVCQPTAVRNCGVNICIASAGANSITAYDRVTLTQLNNRFQTIPNPQDILFDSPLGQFAISGGSSPGQETLWSFDLNSLPGTATLVAGIPGLASLVYFPPARGTGNTTPSNTLVLATSTSTNSIYLIQPAPPPQRQFIISNGASFDQARTAPGALASAIVTTGVNQAINASVFSEPLPKTLGGVTLKIGGTLNFDTPSNQWIYNSTGSIDAPLHFVEPNQINFQVPTGIAPGSTIPAQLTKPDGSTLLTLLNIGATAPGIFSLLQNGQGQGALLNADFSQNGLPQLIVGARPAARGSVIQIFATGAGETNPPLLPGEAAPASGNPLFLTRAQPTVTIGGQTTRVLFSGMAPGWVGLWQINAEIPQHVAPGSAVPLSLTADGVQSNTVTIAVE